MKRGKRGRAKTSSPKRSLNLPDLDQAKSAVLDSLPSKESQRGYRHAIDEFVAWYCSEPGLSFNRTVVTRYASCSTTTMYQLRRDALAGMLCGTTFSKQAR